MLRVSNKSLPTVNFHEHTLETLNLLDGEFVKEYLFLVSVIFASPVLADEVLKEKSWGEWAADVAGAVPAVVEKYKLQIPVYGNYCGPYHSGANYSLSPIDEIDAACRRHDLCYDNGGTYFSCGCDYALVAELAYLGRNTDKWNKYSVGIMSVFALTKCTCKDAVGHSKLLPAFAGLDEKAKCAS
jgi:hypothetical protein